MSNLPRIPDPPNMDVVSYGLVDKREFRVDEKLVQKLVSEFTVSDRYWKEYPADTIEVIMRHKGNKNLFHKDTHYKGHDEANSEVVFAELVGVSPIEGKLHQVDECAMILKSVRNTLETPEAGSITNHTKHVMNRLKYLENKEKRNWWQRLFNIDNNKYQGV